MFTTRDWHHFQACLIPWRDRYLECRDAELAERLARDEGNPTERFWETLDEMKQTARLLQDCFDDCTKRNATLHLMMMFNYGIIDRGDLDGFSEEFRTAFLDPNGHFVTGAH